MPHLERIWEDRNRTAVLLVSGAIVAIVALVDWWTKPYVSLGFLYLFPIIFVAAFLPRWSVALLAACCAVLAEVFSSLEPFAGAFELLKRSRSPAVGLFFAELIRNRRLTIQTEARLKALKVETSPARRS